jgi:hypothetical protein
MNAVTKRGKTRCGNPVLRLLAPTQCEDQDRTHLQSCGPRMHPNDGRVVSNFIVQALLGVTLPFMGTARRLVRFAMSMI